MGLTLAFDSLTHPFSLSLSLSFSTTRSAPHLDGQVHFFLTAPFQLVGRAGWKGGGFFPPSLFVSVSYFFSIHVVFGRVVSGSEFVTEMENQKVDSKSRPYADVRVTNCGELVLMKS